MAETTVKEPELDLARQLVAGLSGDFEPGALTSDYRRDLRQLLEAKLSGEEIAIPEPVAAPAPAVDLMEALKASVKAAKAPKAAGDGKGTTKKRSTSRKRATSKR
jgi:DNA end-binding protein Ku